MAMSLLEEQRTDSSGMSWGRFKEVFFERYFPASIRDAKAAFLDHIVSGGGISVDPGKIEAVIDSVKLKSVQEVQSFLGLAGYYQRFVEGFSRLSGLLTRLTRKDVRFDWTAEGKQSF
ncbi:uncharacterized mitochondrial protein AtMg00860-like [Malania oleifera]|uniref:uncharacterized mitochondrial protein AtMg00860-like n=1 Tax=Malania oleifera TaxID=397392 RepID=UPI0025AE4010|nr:uncharacterized mitochondrial protein AtMg00860-like [Malania oleifera]